MLPGKWPKVMIASAAACLASLSLAVPAAVPAAAQTGPVSSTPASGTPQLGSYTGTTEQVRQLVQCGSTMYAVGTFTTISQKGTSITRDNAFSFSATKPFTVSSWNPNVNGTVNSIALSPDCSTAYLGGKFTSIGGTAVKNIAAVSTSTGAVISTFGADANGQVETLLYYNGHLLTGGYYTSINNSTSDKYMTSLNPTTGKDDGFISLNISGNYQFPGVGDNPTRVYNQQLSNGGTLDLVEGDFTSVGGLPRQQIFMLNLSGSTATVTGWTSAEFNGDCATDEPFYLQAASWAPGDSTIYIATTGYHPYNMPIGMTPRTGLCDAAAAFPATQTSVSHLWINYTGCDSLYSTAADSSTAYFAGHERWSENPDDCDAPGPTAISAPGFEGLSPSTGQLTFNPGRSRGAGADDMMITSAGLWIASDNLNNGGKCGTASSHACICLLPYG